LSTHLRLGLPRGHFPTNILHAFLFSPSVLHSLPISSCLSARRPFWRHFIWAIPGDPEWRGLRRHDIWTQSCRKLGTPSSGLVHPLPDSPAVHNRPRATSSNL
jgi:hypothetical protein